MGDNHKMKLVLATIWLALVVGWAGWEANNYSGLYRWLAEWQLAEWGQYEKMWTAIGPAVILSIPSLIIFRRHEKAQQIERAAGVDQIARLRSMRKVMLIMGIVAAIIGGTSYLLSQRLPDPSAPPVAVDLATLGDSAPPAGPVIVSGGVADVARALQIDEQYRSRAADIDQETIYVPFVAESDVGAGDVAVRIFVSRGHQRFADSNEAPRINVFLAGPMRGTLVQDGVPASVVAAFERQGVKVASSPYLLTTQSSAGRENHYIVAAIGAMFALTLLLMAAVQSLSIARAERRAR